MNTTLQVLRKPLLLFAVSAAGLVAALVSDGAGDGVAWACLGYVGWVGVRCSLRRNGG